MQLDPRLEAVDKHEPYFARNCSGVDDNLPFLLAYFPPGQRVSVGVPGTGLFWVQRAPPTPASRAARVAFGLAALAAMGVLSALAILAGRSNVRLRKRS